MQYRILTLLELTVPYWQRVAYYRIGLQPYRASLAR